MKIKNKLKLALDWTPNINHIGFFIACEKLLYEKYNLKVEIEDPSFDNYKLTPAKKLENGFVDFALCPLESIISYRYKENPINFLAIAKLFDSDLSAIATNTDKIKSPKDLDGKSYASYNARYEDKIICEMVKNDGGRGNIDFVYPEKLGIWNTLENTKYDSTWIFLNWEGVQAESNKLNLKYFKMKDYNIPYSYSPVITAREDCIKNKFSIYKRFLSATKEGFIFAKKNKQKSIEILSKFIPSHERNIDLKKSLSVTNDNFKEKDWGIMHKKNIKNFTDWLIKMKLVNKNLDYSKLFTNTLIS